MTRHNIGFMAVDAIAGAGASWGREKNALTMRTDVAGHPAILAKPQTFMNDSGRAVLALMTFYKIPLEIKINVNKNESINFMFLFSLKIMIKKYKI